MGDRSDCPASLRRDRREALSVFHELWSIGNSSLHRMYSSWEELERSIEVESVNDYSSKPCPYCGFEQRVSRPLDGVFPYLICENCKRKFFVESNYNVRRLSEEEKSDLPDAWAQVVEDLAKRKVAVVLRLES